MRNRIVDSLDLVGLSACYQVSQSSCAVQHEHITSDHQALLFGPEHYEPRYQYPLFLWLHSCHSSEGEIEGVMPALSLQNYVGCAPRGPISSSRSGNRFLWGHSVTATAVAEEIIFGSIDDAARSFSIDQKRVILSGFGSGATMALRVGLRYPELFAGVVAIGGPFPNEQRALSKIGKARSLPILWMYGEQSKQCGVQQVCEALPILHAAGLSLDIRQYCCGDELLSNMLGDANHWIMQLITQQPASSVSTNSETFSIN